MLYDVDDGVATITLNRPDAMNSLDVATKVALRDALQRGGRGRRGARASCSPGPAGRSASARTCKRARREPRSRAAQDALVRTVAEHYNPIVTALATMPKPVVAAVNGVAAGAGRALRLRLRLPGRWPTPPASTLAFAGVALSCDSGSSWTLPRLVGMAKAKELLLHAAHRSPPTRRSSSGLATGSCRPTSSRARPPRSPAGWPPGRRSPTARSAVAGVRRRATASTSRSPSSGR